MIKPWGTMITLLKGKGFWLKFLFVKGRTSLQSHRNRDEWVLGVYKVRKGEVHRMSHGMFFEVALGECSEDDITRYEDDYGRD